MTPDDSDGRSMEGAGAAHGDGDGDDTAPADGVVESVPADPGVRTTTVVRWEAPLPPPALLEQYDQAVPGLASQLARQVQIAADHLQELDRAALKASIEYSTRGQWMGFVVVMAILGIAALATVIGAHWVAGIAMSVVAGAAAVFVLGTLRKKGEKRPGE